MKPKRDERALNSHARRNIMREKILKFKEPPIFKPHPERTEPK
jgi:hypothetical protein